MVRKELSDLKSQNNQLRQEITQLKRDQMEGCAIKHNGRGGYQGNGARNYNAGGWGRENRGGPYKQRGAYRPYVQRQMQAPLEEKRETGFCLRTTGVEDSPDRGGAGHHLARRVRIRAETKMEDICGADERELFKVPIMIADVAELDSEAIGKRTRAGSQRKEEEAAKTTSQDKEDVLTEEDAIKEEPAKMPRLEDIEDVMMEESQTGPEGPPEKYVWGTGGAEMQPEAERLEHWMKFTEDPRYNQERRVSLLKPLGVEAREEENLDQLLTYFPWPGSISIQMPAGQVWGLAKEERILRCNRELREGAEPEERLGLLMEMEGIRKDIAQQHMEEDEEQMHENPKCWWYHKQVKEALYKLHERLGMLVQEADQGLMDVEHFTLAYDYIMLNFARRQGKFVWERYERERVFGEHAQYYAYESGAEVTMTHDGRMGYRVEITMGEEPRDYVKEKVDGTSTSMEYEAQGNGKAETTGSLVSKLKEMDKGANEEMMNQLKETGMEEDEHKKTPDWDSPAEGIKAGKEAGEQDVD